MIIFAFQDSRVERKRVREKKREEHGDDNAHRPQKDKVYVINLLFSVVFLNITAFSPEV